MNKREINLAVQLEGQYLSLDETAKGVCPSCGGGSHAESTFSVTRVGDGLVYNCYRATCGIRGFVATSGRLLQPSKPKDPREALRPYYGEYWPLATPDVEYFNNRFSLHRIPDFGIGVNDYNEYVFAVRAPNQYVRGYVVRRIPWTGEPISPRQPVNDQTGSKSRLFMHAQGASQSWITVTDARSPIVLVEDHISAMRVAQEGINAIALVGVGLDEIKVREIAQARPTEVIIALDQDATSFAFKHARRWGLAFEKVRVAMLSCDIKDTPPENVREVLGL